MGSNKQDIRELTEKFLRARWQVDNTGKYAKAYCPCGRHIKTIHRTPSNPNYYKNALAWLKRQECYNNNGEEPNS